MSSGKENGRNQLGTGWEAHQSPQVCKSFPKKLVFRTELLNLGHVIRLFRLLRPTYSHVNQVLMNLVMNVGQAWSWHRKDGHSIGKHIAQESSMHKKRPKRHTRRVLLRLRSHMQAVHLPPAQAAGSRRPRKRQRLGTAQGEGLHHQPPLVV